LKAIEGKEVNQQRVKEIRIDLFISNTISERWAVALEEEVGTGHTDTTEKGS